MAQPTHNSLIHFLCLWTAILSIVQGVFIVLFFTVGHHGQSQNSTHTAPEPNRQIQENNTQSPQNRLGEMRIYKATEVDGKIIWMDKISDKGPILIEGDDLKVLENGYYFLTLQVTLKTPICPCNGTVDKKCMVKISQQNREILEGWIHKNSCSTGLLAKVEKLSAGTKLNVTIKMPDNEIDERESLTHLGIIMLKL